MTTPFADLFASAESTSIEIDGEVLHSVISVELDGPLELEVVRVRCRSDRPEGIVIDGGDRPLRVGSVESPRITLWSDTAPGTVTVSITEPGPLSLRVWNTWRDDGVAHAWVGWAAMKRSDEGGVTTVSCRDGHADGDFEDLVVELNRESTQDSGEFTTALQ